MAPVAQRRSRPQTTAYWDRPGYVAEQGLAQATLECLRLRFRKLYTDCGVSGPVDTSAWLRVLPMSSSRRILCTGPLAAKRSVSVLAAACILFWLAADAYFSSLYPRDRCEVQFRQDWDPSAAATLDSNVPLSRHCNRNFDLVPSWVNVVLFVLMALAALSLFACLARLRRRKGSSTAV